MIYFHYDDTEPDQRSCIVDQAFRHAGELDAKLKIEELPPCGCAHSYVVLKMEKHGSDYSPDHAVSACCARNSIEVSCLLNEAQRSFRGQRRATAI
ncbi:MAG TPA: hypothetical protein VEX38_04810 [Fimbriimonadaceae bacterium]|nr:hypothetical protein [Fimbriimonadaceae bacterium]